MLTSSIWTNLQCAYFKEIKHTLKVIREEDKYETLFGKTLIENLAIMVL